jgi:hypothetical protein
MEYIKMDDLFLEELLKARKERARLLNESILEGIEKELSLVTIPFDDIKKNFHKVALDITLSDISVEFVVKLEKQTESISSKEMLALMTRHTLTGIERIRSELHTVFPLANIKSTIYIHKTGEFVISFELSYSVESLTAVEKLT